MVDAAEDLGAKSKLRKALIVLAQKVDKGFSGILYFLTSLRQNVSGLAKTQTEHAKEIATLKEQIQALQQWRSNTEGRDAAMEHTGRHDIAKVLARDEIVTKEKEKEHEWRKASVPVKVAAITGFFGLLAGILALITALMK